jgi:DNA-binding NarL/FixJ family response regulator
MDISMPLFNGLDAALELSGTCPKTKIILLTHHDEKPYVAQALRCGAHQAHAEARHSRDRGTGALRNSPWLVTSVIGGLR